MRVGASPASSLGALQKCSAKRSRVCSGVVMAERAMHPACASRDSRLRLLESLEGLQPGAQRSPVSPFLPCQRWALRWDRSHAPPPSMPRFPHLHNGDKAYLRVFGVRFPRLYSPVQALSGWKSMR